MRKRVEQVKALAKKNVVFQVSCCSTYFRLSMLLPFALEVLVTISVNYVTKLAFCRGEGLAQTPACL